MNSREAKESPQLRGVSGWGDNWSYVGESREEEIKNDSEFSSFGHLVVGEATLTKRWPVFSKPDLESE